MFSSLEQKQKNYLKDRRLEQANQERQQDVVDQMNAEKYGLDYQATQISNLAKRVFTNIGTDLYNEVNPGSIPIEKKDLKPLLVKAIMEGNLSQLIGKIAPNLPKSTKNEINKTIESVVMTEPVGEMTKDKAEEMAREIVLDILDNVEIAEGFVQEKVDEIEKKSSPEIESGEELTAEELRELAEINITETELNNFMGIVNSIKEPKIADIGGKKGAAPKDSEKLESYKTGLINNAKTCLKILWVSKNDKDRNKARLRVNKIIRWFKNRPSNNEKYQAALINAAKINIAPATTPGRKPASKT